MNDYHQSSLWKKTLALQLEPDEFSKEREFWRNGFEDFHEKAKLLAAEIALVLPEYTVHSISHIDALWDTAELIIPSDFDINPAESYALGCSFLLHDLGMALAAYPKGLAELKKEPIWQDSAAALRRELLNKSSNDPKDIKDIDEKIEKLATEKTLRLLHAKQASSLAKISWKNSSNQDTFLINNDELRCAFGNVIGLIAYSHNIKVDELEDLLPPTLGSLSRFPLDWTVDPLKLACILRLADATQIDDRRAPSFLKSMRHLSDTANTHWNFQEKLYQARIEKNRIVYTSKSSFSISEVNSWWTCFDTLKMIDNEIKQVDSLLTQKNKQSFNLWGVYSIDDPKKLSKLITVDGWEPVDAKIRVDNVAKLVSSIGGSQLYGNDLIVPLRELIQNASDAIRARRLIEDAAPTYGDIYIRIGKDEQGKYLEIEDNGIGMSSKVLIGPFLDFGQSFWGTDLMHEELPGLESKGYRSTGKYGIGFFSLFMWGDKILVITNRYNKGRADTLALDFNNGTATRPILRKAEPEEYIRNGGTRIRVWVKDNILNSIFNFPNRHDNNIKSSLLDVVEQLCPSIDCNVWVAEGDKLKSAIKANDWITMSADKFLKRVLGKKSYNYLKSEYSNDYNNLKENLSIIKRNNHTVVGRAALYGKVFTRMGPRAIEGVVTVGGFRTSGLSGIVGILIGESERASRDIGIPIIEKLELDSFTNSQIDKLKQKQIGDTAQVEFAELCRSIVGWTGYLKIAMHKNGYLNYDEIREYVRVHKYDKYILVQDAAVFNYERNNSSTILLFDNVFVMPVGIPSILRTRTYGMWPQDLINISRFHDKTLEGLVVEAIADAWNCKVDDLYKNSDLSDDDTNFSEHIGMVDGKEILMDHVDIVKRP